MTFAEKMKGLREASGLSQTELAAAAGVPASSVRNYEQGRRMPTFPLVVKLAKALGVSTDVFAGCSDVTGAVDAGPREKGKAAPAPRKPNNGKK